MARGHGRQREATADSDDNKQRRRAARQQRQPEMATRRGAVELWARADPGLPDGVVFIPFAYREAAANLLTHPQLDPHGKIPGFKYCAARVERL